MKKFRLLLLLFLSFPVISMQAQNVGAGLSLGTLFSQLDGDSFGGYKKIGLHFGGYSWYDFSDRIALQVEILYQNKGAREVVNGYYQQNYHYIDVPILARVWVLGEREKGLYMHGGLAPGFLISAQNGFKNLKTDNTGVWNRFSTDVIIDASYRANSKVSFMLRWGLSIVNINRNRFPWMTNHYFNLAVRIGLK